ncbi:MAG TPA: ATP-binding protein [Gaiellaceae bacterium]|nr:ATP-binding protein [Gaiellaceae bacterium]
MAIAAESALYGWTDTRHWVPDLLAGGSLIGCGLAAWTLRPRNRCGALMAAAGFAWFVPNFSGSSIGAVSWLGAHSLYLYRGPLVQLLLTYPRGRSSSRVERAAVMGGWIAAVVAPVWRSEVVTIVLAAALVALVAGGHMRAVGRERRARFYGLGVALFLAGVFAATAVLRLAAPTARVQDATLLATQVALCLLALASLAGLLEAPWERAPLTDLVVELGEERSGTLRDALARALGDPTLEVAYRLPSGLHVDASGQPVDLAVRGPGRRVTPLVRDGQEVAALIHDEAVLDDPALLDAVAAAARLTASNARLQAEVRAQVAEVARSRRRLLRAGDEEGRRLEQRLDRGALRRLRSLERVLVDAQARVRPSRLAHIERAEAQLARTLDELSELAAGLHPSELADGGLSRALTSLAARTSLPVEVVVPEQRLSAEIEVAVYFVCSEGLANIAKYARASRAAVRVTASDGSVRVEVTDDGVGGADFGGGTGLRGLADRVEALGGSLRVESRGGAGTRLAARIPS